MVQDHLTSFDLLHSKDLDETRLLVSGMFCDHRLELSGQHSELNYRQRHLRTSAMSFSVMDYGTEVRIAPQELDSFFLIQLPLKGVDYLKSGSETRLSRPGMGTIHSPGELFSMNWSADCSKLVVRIEREAIERHAASLLGRPLRQTLKFATEMDTRSGSGLAWEKTVRQLLRGIQQKPDLLAHSMMRAQFDQLIMSGLLLWQSNTLSESLGRSEPDVLPRHLKIVEDYMCTHLEAPITNEHLAALARISLRTLYGSFKKFRGVSPMRYLRELRMEKVREELLDPEKPRSVTVTATQWGFFELGRFAAEYRKRYGEAPSDTLRRLS